MFDIIISGTTFEAQPSDVYVTCNTSIEDVYFRCQHEGSGGWPRWFINSVLHSANDYNLQEQYNINKTLLAPKRITPELNNARYQCQINTLSEGRRRQTLYNSTEGQLIIDCQGVIILLLYSLYSV